MAVELDPNWPGLHPPPDRQVIDPPALLAFADMLDRELENLQDDAAGNISDVTGRTKISPGSHPFGKWDTARDMEDAHNEARRWILRYYQDAIDQLTTASQLIRATAAQHQADDGSTGATFTDLAEEIPEPRPERPIGSPGGPQA